jgi:putative peptidoglycan lipid II flippase
MMAFTERALRFVSSEVRGLHAAAYVLASAALLSSLLALVRDRLLANEFGASTLLDIYYAAFRVPDFLFVATGALVSVYILIPELVRRSDAEQRDYIDTIVLGFSCLAVVLSGFAAIFAPEILLRLFPAYGGAEGQLLVDITRILLLQPILLGLSNVLAAITQVKRRYAIYALSPLLYNIGIILGVVFLYPVWGLYGLAYGVVLGAGLHALIQVPSALSDGFFLRLPRFAAPHALFHTAWVSIPRALALSMNQLAFFGLVAMGSTLAAGSIAVFIFAFNLHAVPLAIIGASYSVAAFPTLAHALSRGERSEFIAHVATAARYVLFWSIPASALILVLRAYVVRVVLGTGSFDWTDTRLTAAAFALLSLSLVSQGIMLLLVRGYYAAGRTFVPFIVSAGMALLTIALAVVFLAALDNPYILESTERLLRVSELPGTNVLALALAFTVSSLVGTAVLVLLFELRFRGFFAQIRSATYESIAAALCAAIAAYLGLTAIGIFADTTSTLSVFLTGLGGGLVGICAAGLTYFGLGSREYAETFASVRARLWRAQPKEEVTLVSSAEE